MFAAENVIGIVYYCTAWKWCMSVPFAVSSNKINHTYWRIFLVSRWHYR